MEKNRFISAISTLLSGCSLAGMLLAVPVSAIAQDCSAEGYSRTQLLNFKASDFEMLADQQRNALAIGLLDCLADPDPALRDGVVYEMIAKWLRAQQLQAVTVEVLFENLMAQVSDTSDAAGFQQPFAALLLSEVARADRLDAVFTPTQRTAMVTAASEYLAQVSDYRGFSETEGWRHGVAHASDWVLQLALNENISAEQLQLMMAAVARKVAPEGNVFYVYGEPGRLARAVFYAHRRGLLDNDAWQQWLAGISDPAPFENWGSTYSSQAGLAKRHNTLAFLNVMYVYAQTSGEQQGTQLAAQVLEALKQVL